MTDEEMIAVAKSAQIAIETMTENVVPLAAGAHVAVLALLDVLRDDPEFDAHFQAALKRRLALCPPSFDVAAQIFSTSEAALENEKEIKAN